MSFIVLCGEQNRDKQGHSGQFQILVFSRARQWDISTDIDPLINNVGWREDRRPSIPGAKSYMISTPFHLRGGLGGWRLEIERDIPGRRPHLRLRADSLAVSSKFNPLRLHICCCESGYSKGEGLTNEEKALVYSSVVYYVQYVLS